MKEIITDNTDYAKGLFGENIQCLKNYENRTNLISDILFKLGTNVMCSYRIISHMENNQFEWNQCLKIYSSEIRKKLKMWDFIGTSLVIFDTNISGEIYCYNAKSLKTLINDEWEKYGRISGLNVFCHYCTPTVEMESIVEKYMDWVEENLAMFFSYQYAIYFKNKKVEIIFWEPKLHLINRQMDIIKEAMKVLFNGSC